MECIRRIAAYRVSPTLHARALVYEYLGFHRVGPDRQVITAAESKFQASGLDTEPVECDEMFHDRVNDWCCGC